MITLMVIDVNSCVGKDCVGDSLLVRSLVRATYHGRRKAF